MKTDPTRFFGKSAITAAHRERPFAVARALGCTLGPLMAAVLVLLGGCSVGSTSTPSDDSDHLPAAPTVSDAATTPSDDASIACTAKFAFELTEIDSLPLLQGEASDLFSVRMENLGDEAQRVHIAQTYEPFTLSKNDFTLAPHASELVIASARIDDTTRGFSTFSPSLEVEGCPAMAPTKKSVSEGWPYVGPSAVATKIAIAQVLPAGTYALPTIDWGSVPCGTKGEAQLLEVQNLTHTAMDVTFSLARGASSPFTLSETSLHMEARSRRSLTLTPLPIPQYPASSAGDAFNDTLNVEAPLPVVSIPVRQVASGHRFSFASSVNFGKVAVGSSATLTAVVRDDGYLAAGTGILGGLANLAVIDTSVLKAPFESSAGTVPIASGVDTSFPVTFRPNATGSDSTTFQPLHTNPSLCAPLPTLTLIGEGI